jgi:hypothetical protein
MNMLGMVNFSDKAWFHLDGYIKRVLIVGYG